MKLAGRNFILVLCTLFGTIVESKPNRTKLTKLPKLFKHIDEDGANGSNKHGLKKLIDNEKIKTFENQKLKKLVNDIEKENVIETIIDKGISKEKSKLATLEKVKHDHKNKITEIKKVPDCTPYCPVYYSVTENGMNASVDLMNIAGHCCHTQLNSTKSWPVHLNPI